MDERNRLILSMRSKLQEKNSGILNCQSYLKKKKKAYENSRKQFKNILLFCVDFDVFGTCLYPSLQLSCATEEVSMNWKAWQ